MSMTRVVEIPTVIYAVECEFCGQVNPSNPFARRDDVEDLRRAHEYRHCRNCYKLDGHESWCSQADRRALDG